VLDDSKEHVHRQDKTKPKAVFLSHAIRVCDASLPTFGSREGGGLIIMAKCDSLPVGVQKDAASSPSLAGCSALRQSTFTYLPARVLGIFRSAKSREQNWFLGKPRRR
jgi:hypothetical protein